MTTELIDVKGALQQALATLSPALPTAWPNETFDPPGPMQPYQRVTFLPAEPDDLGYGGSAYREDGILQVLLCYPKNKGEGDVLTRAGLIRSLFQRGNSYHKGLTTVQIYRTANVLPAIIDADRYCVPVRVRYFANINS